MLLFMFFSKLIYIFFYFLLASPQVVTLSPLVTAALTIQTIASEAKDVTKSQGSKSFLASAFSFMNSITTSGDSTISYFDKNEARLFVCFS